jgi:peroxiredoxin
LIALAIGLPIVLAIIGGIVVAHAYVMEGGPREGALKVGQTVPDFSITTLDGKSVKLSELQKDRKGSEKGVVVLSFWCTSCHSCRHVDADLGKLAKNYHGKAIVMAFDANLADTPKEIEKFLKKSGVTVPVAIDLNGKAADLFGITKTTTTIVIDGEGVLRYCGQFKQKKGGSAEDALKAVLAGNEVAVKTTPHNG